MLKAVAPRGVTIEETIVFPADEDYVPVDVSGFTAVF